MMAGVVVTVAHVLCMCTSIVTRARLSPSLSVRGLFAWGQGQVSELGNGVTGWGVPEGMVVFE